ncbi:cell envelope integrity protein CreD [Janthinobacterium sp. 17J80-10]|uniref:cell envelope integrity protein CreD n=1 Tax=Janthinobacterium sp. 17J80-10 TaxID=2497863 RepID=UPI0010053B32|nr:cell envelope integrity protein CreD [Janthinobacterium sp. 17J80-10]QAU35334.1 cell envelope integrity protein CreD [Janthinobacterium sp. 17J80-10]
MQKTLLFKALIVGALIFLIGLPLMMIQSTISERMAYHAQAVNSIAADSVREQTVIGPLLVIPYTDEYDEEQLLEAEPRKTRIVKRVVSKRRLVFPNDLQVKGTVDTDQRYRGIHKVLVYSSQQTLSGDFVLPALASFEREKPESRLTLGQPFVALTIEDVRGIRNIPKITWNGTAVEFAQGADLSAFKNGLHAPVDTGDLKQATTAKFSFDLGLDGIERLHFVPVAKNNQITLSSKWPHPQFGGRFLPTPKTRTVDANGFSATWNISALATSAQQQLTQLEQAGSRSGTAPGGNATLENLDYFSVGFIEPVDIYSQADRAIKYGLLFVALTFAAFFLFELLKQLPIHPVQYLLVGLALALFFLLLVSLSEHIRFVQAYLIASSACIVLIGFYLAYALRNWKRGMGFGIALTVLYGVLFGLLRSENNALVMGSILLFGVLSAIMIATRKVDWYQVGKPPGLHA